MRITESQLRRIIRQTILEAEGDFSAKQDVTQIEDKLASAKAAGDDKMVKHLESILKQLKDE